MLFDGVTQRNIYLLDGGGLGKIAYRYGWVRVTNSSLLLPDDKTH